MFFCCKLAMRLCVLHVTNVQSSCADCKQQQRQAENHVDKLHAYSFAKVFMVL